MLMFILHVALGVIISGPLKNLLGGLIGGGV